MEEHAVAIKQSKKLTIEQMCMTALMAAAMCILGPMSIPIGEIPVSLTNLVVYLAVYLLGTKLGTLSCIIYLLLGLVGLPVFSGYAGGVGKLVGPTGGYLVGFIFMAWISGVFIERFSKNIVLCMVGMVLGAAMLYLFGTVWYVLLTKCPLYAAIAACVQQFIIPDLLKIVLAAFLGRQVRQRLVRAGLIRK